MVFRRSVLLNGAFRILSLAIVRQRRYPKSKAAGSDHAASVSLSAERAGLAGGSRNQVRSVAGDHAIGEKNS